MARKNKEEEERKHQCFQQKKKIKSFVSASLTPTSQ
jgi:hypothetical protein